MARMTRLVQAEFGGSGFQSSVNQAASLAARARNLVVGAYPPKTGAAGVLAGLGAQRPAPTINRSHSCVADVPNPPAAAY